MAPKGAVCLHLQVLNPNVVLSSISFALCLSSLTLTGMESPFLRTAASSTTDHLNTDFSIMCKKISCYSGELAKQMANHFIAPHYTTFMACLSMWLLNSRLATSFSLIDGFHTS